ncbi:hypothetical protein AAVH_15199, partial [Aphelenchoides avenae]
MEFAESSLSLFPQFEYAERVSVQFAKVVTEEIAEMMPRFVQRFGRLQKFALMNEIERNLVDEFVK